MSAYPYIIAFFLGMFTGFYFGNPKFRKVVNDGLSNLKRNLAKMGGKKNG